MFITIAILFAYTMITTTVKPRVTVKIVIVNHIYSGHALSYTSTKLS